MQLSEPVFEIKQLIKNGYDKKLTRMGFSQRRESPRYDSDADAKKAKNVLGIIKESDYNYHEAREEYIKELSFTLFNRIAGVKVMETHQLIPEVITTRASQGGRSFRHNVWLEKNPEFKNAPIEGLREFIGYEFNELSPEIDLYSENYPYDMFPEVEDLKDIIYAFNERIEEDQWFADDILGWLYEAYNKTEYREFKDSDEKIEYHKLSLSSQLYTPRWVVEFLVNNSLGKLWLEMEPNSNINRDRDIANIPEEPIREKKPVEEIKIIDPAVGSGNFLLYAFELFYDIYLEEGYDESKIPKLILENNLYGVDIDDRAVQIATLCLYVKAKRSMIGRENKIEKMNLVSTAFRLPNFGKVKHFFRDFILLTGGREEEIRSFWEQLREADKFGSLVNIREKDIEQLLNQLSTEGSSSQKDLFGEQPQKKSLFSGQLTKEEFILAFKEAIRSSSVENGKAEFIKRKSNDALDFAEIMMNEYDVAVTNPPYTASADYGSELKDFVSNNYKKPWSFYPNLYACFIKQNSELINKQGKIAMVHPLTFMYISSYKEVREYILNNFHINLFVEFGMGGMFEQNIFVDPAFYILEKELDERKSQFVSLDQYSNTKYQTKKKLYLQETLADFIKGKDNIHIFENEQDKLKLIDGYPFIYWISDSFREKFKEEPLGEVLEVRVGLKTGNNLRFLRYWWEVDQSKISQDYKQDKKKWVPYQKGGEFKRWYGNNWLLVNWENNGYELRKFERAGMPNKQYYFKEGITYTATSSKGISFRLMGKNNIFDVKGSSLFLGGGYKNIFYILSFLNSSLSSYILKSLNSTVETQVGDNKRIPFVKPKESEEKKAEKLSEQNVALKKFLCEYSITERNYKYNPLDPSWEKISTTNPERRLKYFIDYKYSIDTQILINEALIDEVVFKIYELTDEDREMVLEREGCPVGIYPCFEEDKERFSEGEHNNLLDDVREFVLNLPNENRDKRKLQQKIGELYLKGTNVEDISREIQLNPISVVEVIKKFSQIPEKTGYRLAAEFILILIRKVLLAENDGISVVSEYTGDKTLDEKIRSELYNSGYSNSDVINLLGLVKEKSISSYLLSSMFKDEVIIVNKFRRLPPTPFIWHLSSGENNGFDAFIIIYKWRQDSLHRIKSFYLDKRETGLNNRLDSLAEDNSPDAQKEKDIIKKQLREIADFKEKMEDLINSGYDPELDDGVGKNIAPLQKRGLLKEDVLTKGQLKKFLNADW